MKIRLDGINNIDIPFGITSFVGGGGKTSMIEWIADSIPEKYKVIISTTTHMWKPFETLTDSTDKRELDKLFNKNNILYFGHLQDNNKIFALPEDIEKISSYADFVFIEADGSKQLPIKIPNKTEPVLIHSTKKVIGCIGLDCLDKKPCEVLFRYDQTDAFPEIVHSDSISVDDIVKIVLSKQGLKKNINDNMDFSVIFNKVDLLNDLTTVSKLMNELNGTDVHFVSALSRRVFDDCNH